MGEDVKLEVIRSTQESLSKYIKKPPLTEKLLRKPPFRYLHDITTSVMRETGYLQGLYSQDELNPENIKDKEAKIVFLEKLIAAVNLSAGVNITARPNKIVAGLDVAKTNELLQAIAKALEKKIDSSEAVDLVLNKKSKGVNQQATKKEASKSKPSKEAKPVETKTREPRTSDALKKKNKEKTKPVEKTDPKKNKVKKDAPGSKISRAPSKEEPSIADLEDGPKTLLEEINSELLTAASGDIKSAETVIINSEKSEVLENKPEAESTEPTLTDPLQPLSVSSKPQESVANDQLEEGFLSSPNKEEKSSRSRETEAKSSPDTGKENTEDREKKENKAKAEDEIKRPQSARGVHRRKPSSTKTKTAVEEEAPTNQSNNNESNEPLVFEYASKPVEQPETKPQSARVRPKTAGRPASARPGAPRVRDRGIALISQVDSKIVSEPVNLIVDTKDSLDDDDHTLVTVEAPSTDTALDQRTDEASLLTGDQGHLVSQILETQKELEETSVTETHHKVDINWSSGRQRQQEVVVKEVERLCEGIQALTRAANPLGKLIDFLQEDIDSMQAELETWTSNNAQLSKQLQAEQQLTEESIEPLVRQLEDLDQLIEEQLEEMSVVKATIIRNDQRITKLLKSSHPHG